MQDRVEDPSIESGNTALSIILPGAILIKKCKLILEAPM